MFCLSLIILIRYSGNLRGMHFRFFIRKCAGDLFKKHMVNREKPVTDKIFWQASRRILLAKIARKHHKPKFLQRINDHFPLRHVFTGFGRK